LQVWLALEEKQISAIHQLCRQSFASVCHGLMFLQVWLALEEKQIPCVYPMQLP
jgi:hypothetical protein